MADITSNSSKPIDIICLKCLFKQEFCGLEPSVCHEIYKKNTTDTMAKSVDEVSKYCS